MPLRFRDLVGRPGEETVAGLEAAIARASQAATDADAKLADLAKRRRAAIVSDDDKLCDRLDEDIRLTTRDRDKAVEAGLALDEQLAEARQREHQAVVDGLHERAVKARDAAAEILRTKYAKAARAIVAAAEELKRLDAEREALNTRLRQAGDSRQVGSPDEVARPARGPAKLIAEPVYRLLRVPDPADGTLMAWPAGQDIFGGPALRQDRAA
jgi:hypothetical protein